MAATAGGNWFDSFITGANNLAGAVGNIADAKARLDQSLRKGAAIYRPQTGSAAADTPAAAAAGVSGYWLAGGAVLLAVLLLARRNG